MVKQCSLGLTKYTQTSKPNNTGLYLRIISCKTTSLGAIFPVLQNILLAARSEEDAKLYSGLFIK